jgi:hypothetical protein
MVFTLTTLTALGARDTAAAAIGVSRRGTPSGASAPNTARTQRPAVRRISSDPFTNASAQHATEADPSIGSSGSTVVAAFDQGLFANGNGASGIGFAASHDGGRTWIHGSLPGITVYSGGQYTSTLLPTVAYDPRDRAWLITALAGVARSTGPPVKIAIVVSRSTDAGRTWSRPVTVAQETDGRNLDGPAIACDHWLSSRYYGHCYIEFTRLDRPGDSAGKVIQMSASADGGRTWGTAKTTANRATGTAGKPLVRPDGTVVVPIDIWPKADEVLSFESHDGGRSWGPTRVIAHAKTAVDPLSNPLFIPALSDAEDGVGRIYLAWQDCRFRPGCNANDIVMTSSGNGTIWTPVRRVTGGLGDNTLPGIGTDPLSASPSARIGLTYYHYDPHCTAASCFIGVRFASSRDGGATWSRPTQIAGPMQSSWLETVGQGAMISYFIGSTVLPGGNAVTAFPLATRPDGRMLHQDMYAIRGGMPICGGPSCHGQAGCQEVSRGAWRRGRHRVAACVPGSGRRWRGWPG